MPDRYLRGAILDSERFNTLSADAQNFYYRLISIVDDHGCFDGRPAVIAANAYRYGRQDALPIIDLQRNELLVRYLNAGKPYIALTQWGETKRGLRKFPAPPINVDRAEVRYIGIYGRAPSWRNPPRTDLVSIMLDLNGKPVQPQPPEWRRVDGDCSPLNAPEVIASPSPGDSSPGRPGPGTPGPTRQRNTDYFAVTGHPGPEQPGSGTPVSSQAVSSKAVSNQQSNVVGAADVAEQSSVGPGHPGPEEPGPTPPAPTPTTNGKIELQNSGEWHGLSAAQRLAWQDMFAEMSIPDQLDRAAQWLLAHPAERQAYARDEGGHQAYLIRWLLREAKPPQH